MTFSFWTNGSNSFPVYLASHHTARFFPWHQVQQSIIAIDTTVSRVAVMFAQELFLAQAQPCPRCGRSAQELFWLSVTDPEPAWDAGTGRLGWLTLCRECQIQVDFFIDQELTALQQQQWQETRTLM